MALNKDIADAPHHSVLGRPWEYRVTALTFRCPSTRTDSSELELYLEKGVERVHLLFKGVSDLEIDAGFPGLGSGLQILDMSARGMEEVRIRVCSFEQDPAIRLWARSVELVHI